MADSTVLIAIVTGGFTLLGATIPQVTAVMQAGRQARREAQERRAERKRDTFVALRQAIENLKTQIANNSDYHGPEMGARLALVRQYAATAEVHAVAIGLLTPEPLAGLAMRLAGAGAALAAKAAENTDVNAGVMTDRPDTAELETRIAEFVTAAMNSDGD